MKFLISLFVIFISLNCFSSGTSHAEKPTISFQQKSVSNHHHHNIKNNNKPIAILNSNIVIVSETDDVEDQDNDDYSEKSNVKATFDNIFLAKYNDTKISNPVNLLIQRKRLFILLMVIRI